ncbi:sensor histidine kinase [Saccharibacillus alkalitolerans]|uniref:Sensor histidine kinase n=1 Tax=Saccharibacillus alkalitolerans TaxID=2705290 RepID=A0ABX0F7A0_9BACL|nr:histidine kinase [Saccharibacillus alkalitolerans]NGZ75404.1 sensor histidine kinase [Saccharibacillus alkalitolerans]
MLSRLKKWNTLRNQILTVFLVVMVIVLLIVSFLTFRPVSSLLKSNAEMQIRQVAIEASGRFDSLYEQVNMVSKLVTTNGEVQHALTQDYFGREVSFSERQRLKGIVNTIQANSEGIFSFELYTGELERMLPLDDSELTARITDPWIQKADEAKGQLVMLGPDPNDRNYFLAIRRVNLMEHSYAKGGYLLISIYRSYFQFANQELTGHTNQYSILLDRESKPLTSNYGGPTDSLVNFPDTTVQIDGRDYIMTKQSSAATGWTVLILTPVSALTSGVNVLRYGIIFSGFIGFVIYSICSFFLSTMITTPILRLTRTMQQAGEGTLTQNPKVSAVNEINELNSTYNQLVKETNHLIRMVYQKEIIRSHSELRALQAQINPHFLFNALDALRWSLEDNDQRELAEHVIAMSNLFRYTITKQSGEDWVSMKDEIQHIEDYMEIMKMRFGERLKCRISLSPEWERVEIPKLLIQPLVENAVLHGAGNKRGDCTVSLTIEPAGKENRLRIEVRDDGPGMDEKKLDEVAASMKEEGVRSTYGQGMAISNVYKRLRLYYPHLMPEQALSIESEPRRGTRIFFEIPINGGMDDVRQDDTGR